MRFTNFHFIVARHVVEEEKDIKRAMEFLHECDLLKIEDILPFFPDFVTIDHFKVRLIVAVFILLKLKGGDLSKVIKNALKFLENICHLGISKIWTLKDK